MCGILIEFSPKGIFSPNFSQMLDKMEHRGKDYKAINGYSSAHGRFIQIGYNRLAITDVRSNRQGMAMNVDGTYFYCFFNGEIYNYKELAAEFRQPDSIEADVIAEGVARHGIDFISRLNGMFAGVVFDSNGNVWVFRDRYGQKPLYYYQAADTLILSSEIKPIIESPLYKGGRNEFAKKQLLSFNNIFTKDTLFEGVYKMEVATWWNLNSGRKEKYWRWEYKSQPIDYGEAKREVRRLVENAVIEQTPKEVEYGTCLSGGIDSGIIAALLGDIKTFTVGYKGQPDERQLAELLGKQHYEIIYDHVRHLSETIYALENPILGESWMHWSLYELASKFVKVLYDGAGSDELFFSYIWRYSEPDYWKVVNRTGIDDPYCREMFSQVFPEDTFEARRIFDAEHFLGGVLSVVDKLSMQHTIEVRTPFLNNSLVDFVNTLPFEYRANKRVLKDAFADILPPEIFNAPKRGFSTPKGWIEGEHNQARNWIEKALNEWDKLFKFA